MSAQPVGKRTGRVWWHIYSSVSTVSSVRKFIKKSRIRNPIQSWLGIHWPLYQIFAHTFKFRYIHVLVNGPLVLSIIIFINIIPIHSMFKCSWTVRSARCKRNSHRRWTSEKIFPTYASSSPIWHPNWPLFESNLTRDWGKVTILLGVQRTFL